MRATCLQRLQTRGRGAQPRNGREQGEPRDPKGTNDEGGRSEGVRMLCTVRVQGEGAREETKPARGGGRGQAGARRGQRVPRTLLCTVRRGARAHGEGPRGTKHTKGKRPQKGTREGTGAKEENAAQRVVYHAHHASDLSRRVVGEGCTRVAGGQALVCPGHVPVKSTL